MPRDVGYPAGGSLTSDEWKVMLLVYAPAVTPLIWEEWGEAAEERHKRAEKRWKTAEQKRKKDGLVDADKKTQPKPKPKVRMHPRDADNFLNLAAAMKILLARSIDRADLPRARELLTEYLSGLQEVRLSEFMTSADDACALQIRPDIIKPNHHYVTHIFEQILDYGPVYGFWTFLFERLNKILKSYSVNNRDGGELEVTFFREFSCEVRIRKMVSCVFLFSML